MRNVLRFISSRYAPQGMSGILVSCAVGKERGRGKEKGSNSYAGKAAGRPLVINYHYNTTLKFIYFDIFTDM